MKLSVEAREKNYFKAKEFWTPFLVSKMCANLSGFAVWLLEEFRKDKKDEDEKCDHLEFSPSTP